MSIRFLPFALILSMLLLNGCSMLSPKAPSPTTTYSWAALSQELVALESWEILGKINIRNPKESMTAAINSWKQTQQYYEIDLSSTFFGMGATKLSGTPELLVYHEAGEQPLYSDQPEKLVQEALGLPLPLSHLTSWIKALPIEGIPAQIQFDELGLPKTIQQDGWTAEYRSYHFDNSIPLPNKIRLTREQTRITLAIKQWTLL